MNFEWIATCDSCDFTAANPLVDVAYKLLTIHIEDTHAGLASGRTVPFMGLFLMPDPMDGIARPRWLHLNGD
jgi:hypothetical protein